MRIKFWGVRGSVPSGNRETAGVGGNTTCLEIWCGDELIILDSGTGIRNLGGSLMKRAPLKAKWFFSHVHWDHIQGFPFFGPLYVKGNQFDVYGGTSLPVTIKEILTKQMTPPCFPVKADILGATLNYHDIRPGDVVEGENYKVTLAPLYHPNGSYGYRIECGNGFVMVFATDCEHPGDQLCKNLLELSRDADMLIYDAQYTDDEYYGLNGQFSRKGWGHSTMKEAVRMAEAANVKKLVLFHHDPNHSDEVVKEIEAQSRKLFPNSIAAYEGLEIDLTRPEMPKSLFD